MQRTMPVRPVLAVVAVIMCLWFALGARQIHDLNAATAVIAGQSTAAKLSRASSLLDLAGFLNPDRRVQLERATLEDRRGNRHEALRLTQQVLRAEPSSIVGWDLLAQLSGGRPPLYLEALRHIRQLLPPVPRR